MNFIGTATNTHQSTPYGLQFALRKGDNPPSEVTYDGKTYSVIVNLPGKTSPTNSRVRIYRLPFVKNPDARYEGHITSTGRLVLDSKRATKRRAIRAARKAAKRKTYGWSEFVRGTSTRQVQPGRGERAIATDRKSQHKLERWVMTTGIWKLGVFSKSLHYIKDVRKDGGLDFEVRMQIDDSVVGRADAKSEFKTTEAQDRQIKQAWSDGVPCFLVSRTKYLQLTTRTKRRANGSIWG